MFQQHQPNIENMQQYLSKESEKSEGSGIPWWSIPKGMSSVRILPPWDPTGRVALPVYMHPIEFKGAGMAFTKYNWTCVNRTFGKPCPICDGLAAISASGVDTSNWEPSRRQFYFNAIIMHDPTYDQKGKGVAPGTHVLMRAPKTFNDWIISQITNPMVGDITSVTNGIDVYVTKEGEGLDTKYNMTLSPNGRTAIPQEYLDKITDLYNLDDVFSVGFDQQQINELVNTLRNQSSVIGGNINAVANQMAGYQTAPAMNPAVPPISNVVPPMNNPMTTMNPVGQMPNPYSAGSPVAPVQPAPAPQNFATQPQGAPINFPMSGSSPMMTSPSNSPTSGSQGNLPKCYGQYDPGNVNCVVCPHEVNCSQSK